MVRVFLLIRPDDLSSCSITSFHVEMSEEGLLYWFFEAVRVEFCYVYGHEECVSYANHSTI